MNRYPRFANIPMAIAAPLWIVLACVAPSFAQGVYEGFTEPRQDILVAATEIGRLDSVMVSIGEHVVAGQIIGQLEDALQSSAVKLAQWQTEMKGEMEASQAELDRNQSRTEQLRRLSAEGMARPDELDRAETDLRVAKARFAAATEQHEMRKLELERARMQLERRKIRAPADGVISKVFHESGEYVTPGDPAIVRLLVMDKMFAVFNVPVEESGNIEVGVAGNVYLRSSQTNVNALVTSVAPDIDGESGTVEVRVELQNPGGRLLAGDRCTLEIRSGPPPIRSSHKPSDTPTVTIEHTGSTLRR